MSRVRDGEGTHNPGLPLHWLFLLSPAETIHPRAGTIPWGLVIFTSSFFPSRTGVVDGPRQVRGGREWDGPHVQIFGPVSKQVGEAHTDGPGHEAESR